MHFGLIMSKENGLEDMDRRVGYYCTQGTLRKGMLELQERMKKEAFFSDIREILWLGTVKWFRLLLIRI